VAALGEEADGAPAPAVPQHAAMNLST